MLTDGEISRSWMKLFRASRYDKETFDKAELLLEELRPENPLRRRLSLELQELKKIHARKAKAERAEGSC
ncbi:MAG: hypothetical protein JW719_10640 [Pirellulales bacterium]|nr:hypothetical protein [Pirellulales bacterium]